MEVLHEKLESTRRKRVSDSVWAASDAAQFVLNEFRARVVAGTLGVSEGSAPYYIFNPYELAVPSAATFTLDDWERYQAYVLGVIRESTGMTVSWAGPKAPIELRLKSADSPYPDLVAILHGMVDQRPPASHEAASGRPQGPDGLAGLAEHAKTALSSSGSSGSLWVKGSFGLSASVGPSDAALDAAVIAAAAKDADAKIAPSKAPVAKVADAGAAPAATDCPVSGCPPAACPPCLPAVPERCPVGAKPDNVLADKLNVDEASDLRSVSIKVKTSPAGAAAAARGVADLIEHHTKP